MEIIADFHIHSKYSRATSKSMEPVEMHKWAKVKGLNLISTGDITHPAYLTYLKEILEDAGKGLYKLKNTPNDDNIRFILTGEISSIYKQGDKVRKIHNIIFLPSFDDVEKLQAELVKRKCNISSDGRPIVGLSSKDIMEILLNITEDSLLVPAHAWTPWFSIFGSKSGFDSIEECFEDYTKYIYAIETGLSSSVEMNSHLSILDNITLLCNSDAHSPQKLLREANVFNCNMDYFEIINSIKTNDKDKFKYTIEFFPEEGKYHNDGHRDCGVCLTPAESAKLNNICPVCSRPLTIGVLNRVTLLMDKKDAVLYRPSKKIVPLAEIISKTISKGVNTKSTEKIYNKIIENNVSEFDILLNLPIDEILGILPQDVSKNIITIREGNARITPGYDGEFGKISFP